MNKFSFFDNKGLGPKKILNLYPGAQIAFSLRQLNNRIKYVIRASSSGIQKDFTAEQILNGEIINFSNGGNVNVIVWYDQSGNGINLISSSDLPIVENGNLLISNGLPYVEYSGNISAQSFDLEKISGLNNSNGSIFGIYNSNDSSNHMYLTTETGPYIGAMSNGNTRSPSYHSNNQEEYYKNGSLISGANRNLLNDNYVVNTDVLVSMINIDFGVSTKWNSKDIAPFVYSGIGYSGRNKAKEIIIYNNNQSINKTEIESNINSYYSIF
jgi:hypothetical protein